MSVVTFFTSWNNDNVAAPTHTFGWYMRHITLHKEHLAWPTCVFQPLHPLIERLVSIQHRNMSAFTMNRMIPLMFHFLSFLITILCWLRYLNIRGLLRLKMEAYKPVIPWHWKILISPSTCLHYIIIVNYKKPPWARPGILVNVYGETIRLIWNLVVKGRPSQDRAQYWPTAGIPFGRRDGDLNPYQLDTKWILTNQPTRYRSQNAPNRDLWRREERRIGFRLWPTLRPTLSVQPADRISSFKH